MRLSIVIPTYRRPDALPRALDRLERQTIPSGDFEVIVVDDDVEDDAREVERSVGRRPFRVRRLHRHARGVSAARNAGWRAAEAPLVMFLGDDILAAPDLVEQHLAWHERRPDQTIGVLGHVRWARELRRTAFMVWLDEGIQFDYGSLSGDEAGPGHFYTSNISLKRGMLERAGGFDEVRFPFLYEDIDLGLRLAEQGFRLLYNRGARAEHLHRPQLADWRRRMAATAAAERAFVARHPGERAYFHELFEAVRWHAPLRGWRGRLLAWVPRRTPLIGEAIWQNADVYFRQQLGGPFLEAWDAEAQRAASSAGS